MAAALEVVADGAALASAAAARFVQLANDAVARHGAFSVALAGGETPRAAYARIAADWRNAPGGPIDWEKVQLFWGDERMVPPDDARSNFGMTREELIARVPMPAENVHPVPTDAGNSASAAARYEDTIRRAFARDGFSAGSLPRFDLIVLGMGADGHTASLFPGAPSLEESSRLVTVATHPETGEPRVTMTLPVLNNAANLVVLVSGAPKSAMLERAVRGVGRPAGGALLPVERLEPTAGNLLWLADEAAAPWARTASRRPGE